MLGSVFVRNFILIDQEKNPQNPELYPCRLVFIYVCVPEDWLEDCLDPTDSCSVTNGNLLDSTSSDTRSENDVQTGG